MSVWTRCAGVIRGLVQKKRLEQELDEELQALYLEERKIAEERGHAVLPTFTDVVTIVIKAGILERKKWILQEKSIRK